MWIYNKNIQKNKKLCFEVEEHLEASAQSRNRGKRSVQSEQTLEEAAAAAVIRLSLNPSLRSEQRRRPAIGQLPPSGR